jgi:hypothetical protein
MVCSVGEASYSVSFDFPQLRFSSVYVHVHAGILFFTAQASICPHAWRLSEVCQAPGPPTRPLQMPGAAQEWPTAAPSGVPLYMRVELLSSIAIDKGFALTMAGWHASSIRSMLLPLRLSLWPDPVSILSNPLFGTPALVSCAHPHAKLRFLSGFSHAHTHLRYTFAPFPRSIRCETAATQSRRWYISSPALPTRVARLARSAPLSRRVC